MPAHRLVLLGILAALGALFQLSGAVWPGPGYLLAALAGLPIALAARLTGRQAWICLAAAGFLLVTFHLEEAMLFTLLNGPVGLITGLCLRRGWGAWRVALAAGLALLPGLLLLAYGIGFMPLGPQVHQVGIGAYGLFALTWGLFYSWLTRLVWQRLRGVDRR